MLGNFIKVAYRVFIRNLGNTLIDVFGLAIGLTFSIIIFLYAYKELSYDKFHKKGDRIYRVGIQAKIAENKLNIPFTSTPLAGAMIKEIPEVEDAVRVARFGAWLLRNDSIRYNEDNLIFTDPGFFNLFSFPLVKGNPKEVLSQPYSIVLSETSAKRYFGEENPVGKKLRVENDSTFYSVTGVMKDIPENSHIRFDMVGAISTYDKMLGNDRWVINYLYTYFAIWEGVKIDPVQKGLRSIVNNHVIPEYQELLGFENVQTFNSSNYYNYIVQPLTDIHLESLFSGEFEPAGKFLYVYLFIILAVFILVLSCMNFVSLVTAQSLNRAREVGVRKISGSERYGLIKQFLLESSILAFLALTIALLFTELALPSFSRYIGIHLSLRQLFDSSGIALLSLLVIVIGIVAGLYPAWYLSSYNPKSVLRNRFDDHPDKGHFRTALAVFQLFLAVGAITISLIVISQFRYLINKDRGYDGKDLVVIRRPDALTDKLEKYKKEIMQQGGVVSVTNSTSALGSGFPRFPYHLEGTPLNQSYSASTLLLSFRFDSVYRIKMASGRFFNPAVTTDSFACVINETAARVMNIDEPTGKAIVQLSDRPGKSTRYEIIGVVNDFNFETLENPIKPLIMILMPGNLEGYLTVRLSPENQDSTIQYMKKAWEKYTDAYPFVYYFLDEDRKSHYQPVRTTARIFILLSIVTTVMACLSLFALVAFTYNRKQREISILKTMGASRLNIIMRRVGEIVLLVIAASIAAWVGAYILATYWLSDYAYQINVNILYFLSATLIIVVFSLASVYYHTRIAASANPGRTLKYE
jgi:putative ABC transport system permease protein